MAKLIIEGQAHEVPDILVLNGATVAEQDQGYTRIVRRLAAGKSELTPVMLLACEVQLLEARGQLQLAKLIVLRPRIERVLAGGRSDQQRMAAARRVLLEAPATAATTVPAGF